MSEADEIWADKLSPDVVENIRRYRERKQERVVLTLTTDAVGDKLTLTIPEMARGKRVKIVVELAD